MILLIVVSFMVVQVVHLYSYRQYYFSDASFLCTDMLIHDSSTSSSESAIKTPLGYTVYYHELSTYSYSVLLPTILVLLLTLIGTSSF